MNNEQAIKKFIEEKGLKRDREGWCSAVEGVEEGDYYLTPVDKMLRIDYAPLGTTVINTFNVFLNGKLV